MTGGLRTKSCAARARPFMPRSVLLWGWGGVGVLACRHGCVDLICSWRCLLADRHSLPFPWILSLCRRWCSSASHHPVSFLLLLALSFLLSFPFLSLGRLCQRSPRTFPVPLLCVGSTQRRATALAVGQIRPSGHPKPAVRDPSTAAFGPWDVHLRGLFLNGVEWGGSCRTCNTPKEDVVATTR